MKETLEAGVLIFFIIAFIYYFYLEYRLEHRQ